MAPARHVESALPARRASALHGRPSRSGSVSTRRFWPCAATSRWWQSSRPRMPIARTTARCPAARSRRASTRRWKRECASGCRQQTGVDLGATRQIGTLGDCRVAADGPLTSVAAVVSVGYLAPVGPEQCSDQAVWPGTAGTRIFRGRTGAAASRSAWPRRSSRASRRGPPIGRPGEVGPSHEALDRRQRLPSPSAARGWPGTRRGCSSATSCCARPA